MIDYATLKTIHMTTATLSFAGFILRGIWMMIDSAMLRALPVRILPHIIDTVLLASGLWLAYSINQYPFSVDWLTAKLLALIGYIVLGTFALKRGKTKPIRIVFFVLAIAVFVYMMAVAKNHSATLGLF